MNDTCDVGVQFEATEPERLEAIKASATSLLAKMMATSQEECIWSLAESVWPALTMSAYKHKPIKNSTLRLVPLTRIGQMEGKSGSLVVIGYFVDTNDADRPHSHPVVVKTRSVEQSDKLQEEYENARSIKPFAYDQKDSLAIPIFFDAGQAGFNVLWSILSPNDPIWPGGVNGPAPTALKVRDLREPLELGEDKTARSIIDKTFRLLKTLHHRLNKACIEERLLGDEYKRYLRNPDDWGKVWKESWRASGTHHVEDAGGHFVDPFWVVERLQNLRKPMYVGAVHGDLHPGNVVLVGEQPRIIDFGWAQDGAHVAKDFVLMECNLRFHTVRPQLNQRDVYALSDWIRWDAPIPQEIGAYARGRAELIQHLRSIAKETFQQAGREPNWDWEYLVPLFLVAFGLLRFTPLLGNQQAAVRFVLALATHIERVLQEG